MAVYRQNYLATLNSALLSLLCVIFVLCHSAQGLRSENGAAHLGVRTYADVLKRASLTAQMTSDHESKQTMEYLNDRFERLHWTLQSMKWKKPRRLSADLKQSYGTVGEDELLSISIEEQISDSEQVLLQTLLQTLDSLEENGNLTSICVNDTARLITSLFAGESWAIPFLDSAGKPGPSLSEFRLDLVGNYEQCRAARSPSIIETTGNGTTNHTRPGFKGNYCPVGYVTYTEMVIIRAGMCFPDTCSPLELTALAKEIVRLIEPGISSELIYAECLTAPTQMTTAAAVAIIILATIGTLMVLGTLYDVLFVDHNLPGISGTGRLEGALNTNNDGYASLVHSEQSSSSYSENPSLTLPSSARIMSGPQEPRNCLEKVLLAFSVYSNGKKLLSTAQSQGSLGTVHGIRFLSMSWVVLCHVYTFVIPYTLNITTVFPEWIHRWTILPIFNGFTSVDSFFTLSGLLTAYLAIQEINRRQTWKINWPMFYFHRFWRLTPPYMFTLVIALGLTQYFGEGPLWNNSQPGDKEACETNWWTNLLYVNNVVKPDMMCFGHSWYLANDMQFFLISPLMLVPFYFHRIAGYISCGVFLLATWITTAVLSVTRNWPVLTVTAKPVPGRATQAEWFNEYYIVPWCRIGPYVVGIMAGYVLAMTKGRQFRLPWWIVVPGWVVSVASGLAVVYGLHGDVTGDNPSSVVGAAFYNALARSAWGACICWIVVASSAGYGGLINSFLSWPPFVVLGRLTYMTYLIHLTIGGIIYENLEALIFVNDTTIVIFYLGILIITNMASFVLVLALESPMLALEKAFIRK